MSEFSGVERPAVFPLCFLLDVSYSMAGPALDAVNTSLGEIKQAILDDPGAGEIARLTVVTFSDSAQTVLELTDLKDAQLPYLTPQSNTNFAAGLRTARQALRSGISGLGRGARFHRPVVFFVSDGEHNARDDWRAPFKELTGREDKYGAEVVSFGFHDANRQVIQQLSTRYAFFANDTDPAAAVREILKTIMMSIRTTSSSFTSPTGAALSVPHDSSKLTQLPQYEV